MSDDEQPGTISYEFYDRRSRNMIGSWPSEAAAIDFAARRLWHAADQLVLEVGPEGGDYQAVLQGPALVDRVTERRATLFDGEGVFEIHDLASHNHRGGFASLDAALTYAARTYPPTAIRNLVVGRQLPDDYQVVMHGRILAERVDLARSALEHSTFALLERTGGNVVASFTDEDEALAYVYGAMEGDDSWALVRFGPTPADNELIAVDRELFERALARANDSLLAVAKTDEINRIPNTKEAS